MKKHIRIWAVTTLGLTGLANAQIYKSVDANGVVTFSDMPPKGQEETVEKIQPPSQINSMQAIAIPSREVPGNSPEEVTEETTLSIVSPSDNATVPMGAGIFDVQIDTSPELADDETFELYLDNEKVGEAQVEREWTLSYVIRGPHRIQAKRLAEDGTVLAVSEPITVFVLRPSIL